MCDISLYNTLESSLLPEFLVLLSAVHVSMLGKHGAFWIPLSKLVRALSSSRHFPSFLFFFRIFLGGLPLLRIKCGTRGPAVVPDRPDTGKVASQICIATKVCCTLCSLHICSSFVRTESLLAGQPRQPPLDQVSDSLIPAHMSPRIVSYVAQCRMLATVEAQVSVGRSLSTTVGQPVAVYGAHLSLP